MTVGEILSGPDCNFIYVDRIEILIVLDGNFILVEWNRNLSGVLMIQSDFKMLTIFGLKVELSFRLGKCWLGSIFFTKWFIWIYSKIIEYMILFIKGVVHHPLHFQNLFYSCGNFKWWEWIWDIVMHHENHFSKSDTYCTGTYWDILCLTRFIHLFHVCEPRSYWRLLANRYLILVKSEQLYSFYLKCNFLRRKFVPLSWRIC
jgi:hypothetical protein